MRELVEKINKYSAIERQRELTESEKAERQKLRQEYLKKFRQGFKQNILDNMYIVDKDGNKKKVTKGRKK